MYMGRTVPRQRGRIGGRTMPSHGGSLGSGVSTPGVSLTAPVLTWVSDVDDNTPLFQGMFTDLQVADVGRLQLSTDVGFSSPIEATNAADAAEVLALQLDYTSGALSNVQYWARVRHERGASVSSWSNVETKTVNADATAPVLSLPVDTSTGADSGSGTVSTTEGNGTLYWVLSSSATPPSATQIKAGQMHTGAAAALAGSQAVSGTGVQTVSGGFTGLISSTTYYAHYMQEDASPQANRSNVASGDGFTTSSGKAYVYRGSNSTTAAGNPHTASIDIGTASADRVVHVGIAAQNAQTPTSVTVNGVTLTQDVLNVTSPTAGWYSGVVASGSGSQTVTVNYPAGTFTLRNMYVLTSTGLSSTTKKQSASASGASISINVTAGDFLFAVGYRTGGIANYTSSTEAPDGTNNADATTREADWVVNSTNATFFVTPANSGSIIHAAVSFA
jgi:hypothetical protein